MPRLPAFPLEVLGYRCECLRASHRPVARLDQLGFTPPQPFRLDPESGDLGPERPEPAKLVLRLRRSVLQPLPLRSVGPPLSRAKLPGVPLGVRVTPDWVAAHPPLAPLIDYTWAQYHTRKGEQQAYYDRAASIAQRLGLRVVMGVNVHDCHGVGTDPCTPAELVKFGTMAVSHPASCAFLNWRYDEATWSREEIRTAWEELAVIAKSRRQEECRRAA